MDILPGHSPQHTPAQLEVGTRVAGMAKDVLEDQGAALIKLLDSTKMMELSVQPHLGSILDVRG